MKTALSLILALLLCVSLAAPALAVVPSGITVTVNGKDVDWTDAKPFIDENDRAMVPLRAVADAMGLKVSWYPAEREAAFTDGGKVIYFPIGSSTAPVSGGGGSVKMDTAAVIANDRTYAPARYLAEFFGYEADWDGKTRTVSISKGNSGDFVCGETSLHKWKAANFQVPTTCAVCGATKGSVKTPDFVTYGIRTDMAVGVHYDYETITYYDPGAKTTGDLAVLDYSVFRSDGVHEAKDGCEWRAATFQLLFPDESTLGRGFYPATSRENYYDIRLNDDSVVYNETNDAAAFTVNYYGEKMKCSFLLESLIAERREGTVNITFRALFQVPVGYDGCVFGVFDKALKYPDGGYICDVYDPGAFFLFRFA